MTEREFRSLISVHKLRGQSVEACRRVLIDGQTAYQVAKDMNLDKSTISRALAKMARPLCKCCGQPLPGAQG